MLQRNIGMRIIDKLTQRLKFLWITAGTVLVLLLFLETMAGLAFFVRNKLRPKPIDYRVTADSYRDSQWAEEYFQELFASRPTRWHPYIHHKRCAFKGKYINIDNQGKRYTWNPKSSKSDKPIKIFVFGGSSIWGIGTRDEDTIPSLISKVLTKSGDDKVMVTNFGESGYTSTQALLTLILELRKGNIPDLVIYYGGINDVFAAFQSHTAGIPQNEDHRQTEFNISYSRKRLFLTSLTTFTRYSHVYRIVSGLKPKIIKPNLPPNQWQSNIDYLQLAGDTADIYSANLRIFEKLANAYGLETLFYWHPVIFTKDNLSAYERKEAEKANYLKKFYTATHQTLTQNEYFSNNKNFHDLSLIFQKDKEPFFIDFMHLTKQGNNIVTKHIVEDILRIENLFSARRSRL